jgi:hypothetical protein
MAQLLTTNLRMELERTNAAFNRWAERTEDELNASSSLFTQNMEECEHTILALQENNKQLEEVRFVNMEIKAQQKAEFESCVQQTANLKDKRDLLNNELRKYEAEEAIEAARLEKVRQMHDTLRDKMERTLNDLTHGVRLYSSLGLEFQKAEGECMKFIFTQISVDNPSKPFWFTMFVDDNELYQLVETRPVLAKAVCTMHVKRLNEDNNIRRFVVSMRKAFKSIA